MTQYIFFITEILLALYCLLIFVYAYWFWRLRMKTFSGVEKTPQTKFSIVIPARNEEANIAPCLLSILDNNYPKNLFEIMVVDDESKDRTAAIVRQLSEKYPLLKLLNINDWTGGQPFNSHKKKAIEFAVSRAANDWMITTDADCIVPKNWLASFDKYIRQTQKRFIAAPVAFTDNHSFLGRFQCLDFLSLQGITIASVSAGMHNMCNGANLCYEKQLFLDVRGFAGIDQWASGDDMLLMDKVQRQFPDAVGYLYSQSAIVFTAPMPTWKAFIHQRIRWASKNAHYRDVRITAVLCGVYLTNLFLLISLVYALFQPFYLLYWFGLVIVKTLAELLLMQPTAAFFKQKKLLKWFPLMQPLHIFYIVAAGFLGMFGKYQWKERMVK